MNKSVPTQTLNLWPQSLKRFEWNNRNWVCGAMNCALLVFWQRQVLWDLIKRLPEMRCLSFLLWETVPSFLTSSTFPHSRGLRMRPCLSHTDAEQTHCAPSSAPMSLWTHTKCDTHEVKHKLFPAQSNRNRRVCAASRLDASALPALRCFIKNSIPIIVRATNRWRQICLALTEVTWKLPPPSLPLSLF